MLDPMMQLESKLEFNGLYDERDVLTPNTKLDYLFIRTRTYNNLHNLSCLFLKYCLSVVSFLRTAQSPGSICGL